LIDAVVQAEQVTSGHPSRRSLTHGQDKVQGEWTWVCLAWNLKRMAVLRPQ